MAIAKTAHVAGSSLHLPLERIVMKDFIAFPKCFIVALVALTSLSGCNSETPPISQGSSSTNTSPANAQMVFKSAKIRLFFLPRGVPENFATDAATKAFVDPTDPTPIVISDQASIDKLVACFPGVGSKRKSPESGAWEKCGEIVFIAADSTEVSVSFDDKLSTWSEVNGDLDIENPKTLRGIILSSSNSESLQPVGSRKMDTENKSIGNEIDIQVAIDDAALAVVAKFIDLGQQHPEAPGQSYFENTKVSVSKVLKGTVRS